MISSKLVLAVVVVFLICFKVNAMKSYYGDQVWKVVPTTNKQVDYLKNLQQTSGFGVDAWTEVQTVNQYGLYHVSKQHLNTLRDDMKKHEIEPIVTIQNLQTVIQRQAPSSKSATPKATSITDFDYSVYHTAQEIYQWIDFAAKEPNVEKFQIGITYEGRPMYALKIGPNDGNKPIIYLDALIHCREWITTATTIYTFKEILTNPTHAWMKNNVDWVFIPMINVDGYVYTHTEDRFWRKTRSQTATVECPGVDANRNWDDHWSGEGTEKRPCSNVYHGPKPESESEVRHLARYITANKDNITAVISVHSYSQLILYPFNFRIETEDIVDNKGELQTLGDNMAAAIKETHGKDYIVGPGAETIYVCSGVTTDWTYGQAGIKISYTYELRDTGEYGFALPADQILPTGQEFFAAMVKLAEHVDDSVSGSGAGNI